MKRNPAPLVLATLALLAACAGIQSDARFHRGVDFSRLRGFHFTEPDAEDDARHALVRRRLVEALAFQGYVHDPRARPSFLVGFRLRGDRDPAGIASPHALHVEFLAAATRERFWEGWADGTWYAPIEEGAALERAVDAVIDRFPAARRR